MPKKPKKSKLLKSIDKIRKQTHYIPANHYSALMMMYGKEDTKRLYEASLKITLKIRTDGAIGHMGVQVLDKSATNVSLQLLSRWDWILAESFIPSWVMWYKDAFEKCVKAEEANVDLYPQYTFTVL